MSMAGGFLGGAQDRLLPAAIPFRFFVTACMFHLLAWIVLFLAADDVAGFRGGTGPVLAAIHLLTLGTLAMTAIGASFQLFPVVTRQALARTWPGHLCYALMLPGVILLSWGMGVHDPVPMRLGAGLVCAGLLVFTLLTADNLRRAGSVAVVAAHGALSLIFLIAASTLGLVLVWDVGAGFLTGRGGLVLVHLALAGFGFMGVLILGLSLILIPMFVLSRSPPARPGWVQLGLATLALLGFSAATLGGFETFTGPALILGIGATGVYLALMRRTLNASMRKRLGLSFVLLRLSWAFLVLTLLLETARHFGLAIPNAPSLIGFTLLAGWLLTFLCGVLQRIMPFLASMHAAGKSGLPPLMSEMAADGPLKLHAICHVSALIICGAGILTDLDLLLKLGAAVGAAGAAGFAWFAASVALKTQKTAQKAGI